MEPAHVRRMRRRRRFRDLRLESLERRRLLTGDPPSIAAVPDVTTTVGTEVEIVLTGTDPEGDRVFFAVSTPFLFPGPPTHSGTVGEDLPEPLRVQPNDHVEGNPDAPVVLIEAVDFQ